MLIAWFDWMMAPAAFAKVASDQRRYSRCIITGTISRRLWVQFTVFALFCPFVLAKLKMTVKLVCLYGHIVFWICS